MASLQRRYGLFAFITACFLFFLLLLRTPDTSARYTPGQTFDTHPGDLSGATVGTISEEAEEKASGLQKSSSRFKWADVPTHYPVTSFRALPTGQPLSIPQIQHDFGPEPKDRKALREVRRAEVKKAFERCWKSYSERAWLKDELAPISGAAKNTFGGWAATLVDALDTLWIMGLKEEFKQAVIAVEKIDFETSGFEEINVFETTIRYLGGFLSAYDLSGEKILLQKALEVAGMLYVAFDTPNRMPITRWNIHKAKLGERQIAAEWALVAEIGSLTMEFTHLTQITGDPKWYDAVARIIDIFDQQQNQTKLPGMWPISVNPRTANLTYDTAFTLGAMADSVYEYFPKMHALLGGLDPVYQKLYEGSMATAIQYTLYRPMTPENVDILMSGFVRADEGGPKLAAQLQHLVCFTGGMFALGGRIFNDDEHIKVGRKLTDGCIWAYKTLPFGIMPEVSHLVACNSKTNCEWDEEKWKTEVKRLAVEAQEKEQEEKTDIDPLANIASQRLPKGFSAINDRRYILRPEAIESVFILYRITGEQQFQAAAWDMFTTVQKYTQTDLANAALADVSVTEGTPPKIDSMESFWLAETLKYFYLIFSEPDLISLDEYVLNTEAHPFKRPKA